MKPYYQGSGVSIYHGDCSEIMHQLGQFDAVLTDPPYAVPTIVAAARNATRNAGDLSMIETAYRFHADLWAQSLGDKGRAFVFCDGASYPSVYRAMYGRYSLASLVWSKKRIGMGREFRKSHELIIHAWLPNTPVFSDGVGRADVLEHAPVPTGERIHPAEKPISLLSELLIVSGHRILDPFMGSGSTLMAAAYLCREAVGIELEERYCEMAAKRLDRISEAQFQQALIEAERLQSNA